MKNTILFFVLLLVASCSEEQETDVEQPAVTQSDQRDLGEEVMLRVREQQRLHVAEYGVHKIITHDDLLRLKGKVLGVKIDEKLSIGDRKIAIPIDVVISGYIDFGGFNENQVEIEGNSIQLTLPDPQFVLVSSSVDHDATRQYVSMLRSNYTDKEMTEFTKQGVESLLRQVDKQSLLTSARTSAATMLIPLLSDVGFAQDSIKVTFRNDLKPSSLTIERRNR